MKFIFCSTWNLHWQHSTGGQEASTSSLGQRDSLWSIHPYLYHTWATTASWTRWSGWGWNQAEWEGRKSAGAAWIRDGTWCKQPALGAASKLVGVHCKPPSPSKTKVVKQKTTNKALWNPLRTDLFQIRFCLNSRHPSVWENYGLHAADSSYCTAASSVTEKAFRWLTIHVIVTFWGFLLLTCWCVSR